MQKSAQPSSVLKEKIRELIESLRSQNSNFESAYDTYTQEYGKDKINLDNEPLNLAETIDPVTIILGRNCALFYSDPEKELRGPLGRVKLPQGEAAIIGRRQPQDSKLVVWTSNHEVELQEYNSWSSTIPSRVHAAIVHSSEKEAYFFDLGSSSGTVLVGESLRGGPFARVYDPSPTRSPTIKFDRISTARKS